MGIDELVIGYDLCNDYSQISYFLPADVGVTEPENLYMSEGNYPEMMPVAVCKKRGEDSWLIGEEAFRAALLGSGIMADKLMKQVAAGGTATIEGNRYTARDLLYLFLELTMKKVLEKNPRASRVGMIVFTIQKLEQGIMDSLIYCMDRMGLPREHVFIMSHTESFMYYALSQSRELWMNQVGLFDLSDEGLNYYELDIRRGVTPKIVTVKHERLEDGFSPDILDTPTGEKMADSILSSCASRLLQKKTFSTIYLGGKGFYRCQEWANVFLKTLVGGKRRVFATESIFAKGAAYAGIDHTRAESIYPYVFICEGRLTQSVYMNVVYRNTHHQLILGAAGENWYETRSTVDLIVDGETAIELQIVYTGEENKKDRTIFIPLKGIPERPNKTTRLSLTTAFTSETTMLVRVEDLGFGELFPASGWVYRDEISL